MPWSFIFCSVLADIGSGDGVGGGEFDCGRRIETVSGSSSGSGAEFVSDSLNAIGAGFGADGATCCFKKTPKPPSSASSWVTGARRSSVAGSTIGFVSSLAGRGLDTGAA